MISLSRFDLVSLRLFVVVVDAGSLTGGAQRFGISLAAASKRVAELEHHAGTPLLERGSRGVVPTAAGQTLYRHAIGLVAKLEQLALALGDYRGGAQAHVRLAANTSAVNGFLPAVLARFAGAEPKVHIDLAEALSHEVVHAVASGAADMGVFADNTPAPGLVTSVCDTDALVLLVARGHALARARRVRFAQALQHDFIGLERNSSLMRLLTAAAGTQPLRVRVQVSSFDGMCRMVAVGLGVAVLPRAAAAPHVASMKLASILIDEPWAERRLLLGVHDRERLSGPARALVTLIEARA